MNHHNLAPQDTEQSHDSESFFDDEKREYAFKKVQELFDRMEAVKKDPDEDTIDILGQHNSYEISTKLADAHEKGIDSIVEWEPDEIVVTEVNKEGDLSQTRVGFIRIAVMGKDSTRMYFRRSVTNDPRNPESQPSRSNLFLQIIEENPSTFSEYDTFTYEKRTPGDDDRSFMPPELESWDSGEVPEGQQPRVVAAFIDKLERVVESEEAATGNTEKRALAIAGTIGETARKG